MEKQTNVPVIDIGISQYDIIRTIKSIPDLSKSAIICYDAFDQAISQTLAQFNIKMTKYVVQKKMDIKNAMAKLAASGYHNIICDSGIIVASNNIYHLNSYLIESGDEVVYQALKTCFLLLRKRKQILITSICFPKPS
ncbi:PrpR N-terminal domain-containing protein [Lactobacillus sp. R2/2]|nr:PrpR N-terminal domain-containing protein [Lactobacillus sp. R2/2]